MTSRHRPAGDGFRRSAAHARWVEAAIVSTRSLVAAIVLRAAISGIDVDSVTVELRVRLMRQCPRPRSPALAAFVGKVVDRLCIDAARSERSRRVHEVQGIPDGVMGAASPLQPPGSSVESEEIVDLLFEASQGLPFPYRVVLLGRMAGWDTPEIAARAGIKSTSVATTHRRALELVRPFVAARL